MHVDFAPDIAGGAMFPYLEGMVGPGLFGMVIGKGGADMATRALGHVGQDEVGRGISLRAIRKNCLAVSASVSASRGPSRRSPTSSWPTRSRLGLMGQAGRRC